MQIKKLIDPENSLWTIRRGAVATVRLGFSRSRYTQGEIVIETQYRLANGKTDLDPTSRIWLGDSKRDIATQLYDKLLDSVLIAQQYETRYVIIECQQSDKTEWSTWMDLLSIVVYIVAYELQVPISGLAVMQLPTRSTNSVRSNEQDRNVRKKEDEFNIYYWYLYNAKE
jgi:hypothetical protein